VSTETIRAVLAEHGQLSVAVADLREEDDLFELGMTSHASVAVMLALEEVCGVEFPEYMLKKRTFSSIASIRDALGEAAAAESSPPGAASPSL
jgi:acyl carrier protein